jgi:hypothetical protein
MGLFKRKCLVYTPANDVDLSPYSTEFYLQANVKGSKMHSHIFIAFLFSYSVGYDFLAELSKCPIIVSCFQCSCMQTKC